MQNAFFTFVLIFWDNLVYHDVWACERDVWKLRGQYTCLLSFFLWGPRLSVRKSPFLYIKKCAEGIGQSAQPGQWQPEHFQSYGWGQVICTPPGAQPRGGGAGRVLSVCLVSSQGNLRVLSRQRLQSGSASTPAAQVWLLGVCGGLELPSAPGSEASAEQSLGVFQ